MASSQRYDNSASDMSGDEFTVLKHPTSRNTSAAVLSADRITNSCVSPTSEIKLVRLVSQSQLELALMLLSAMKRDRPHMAAQFGKLLPQQEGNGRVFSSEVTHEVTHIWAMKAVSMVNPSFEYLVGVIWFRIERSSKATASIEVLWIDPRVRSLGYGTRFVQSIFVRYPHIAKWTAFASRDTKKDAGVISFWTKNGFSPMAVEVGNVMQDGFFVRTVESGNWCPHSKRRRFQPRVDPMAADEQSISNSQNQRLSVNTQERRGSASSASGIGTSSVNKSIDKTVAFRG